VVVNEDDPGAVKNGNWTPFGITGVKPNIFMTNTQTMLQ
jgi:hypothetical protein